MMSYSYLFAKIFQNQILVGRACTWILPKVIRDFYKSINEALQAETPRGLHNKLNSFYSIIYLLKARSVCHLVWVPAVYSYRSQPNRGASADANSFMCYEEDMQQVAIKSINSLRIWALVLPSGCSIAQLQSPVLSFLYSHRLLRFEGMQTC